MKDPFPKFEEEVDRRKHDYIDNKIENELYGAYASSLNLNLRCLRNRLDMVLFILEQDENFRDLSNLFVIK